MLGLSLGPGLGYIFLGYLYDALVPTVSWYGLMLITSVWGYWLYRHYNFDEMTQDSLNRWRRQTSYLFYILFALWTVIFILIVPRTEHNLHYVAIFTQIGSSVVASTLLFSDRRLFMPSITIVVVPLIIYFALLGEWYSYVLTIFSIVFWWVLYYSSNSSYKLLQKSYVQSSQDQLTGMYNRAYFIDAMEHTINDIKETGRYCCLILIDLDYFKTINDSLGHDIGDVLLKEVADRVTNLVPEEAIAARMGGDEFIVISPANSSRDACTDNAIKLAEQLRDALKEIYQVDRHHLYISASIGVSVIHNPDSRANKYIKEADIAMYEVKDKGRDGVILFTDDVAERVEKELEIERLLHFSLERGEVYLNFQPQLDSEQKIVGCEVLVRWENSTLGNVSPSVFIPIAEKTGLIVEIGKFVLEESFKTLRDWEQKGIALEQFSINVSMRQFFDHSFSSEIKKLCGQYLGKEQVKKVVLELTESSMAEELGKLIDVMNDLRAYGLSFSIDDFGTGYSSLGYLRQVPLDEVKIDRSFVSELLEDKNNQAMIETIIHIAQVFGLKVVAEGVETDGQKEFLLENKCDLLQGYLFSKPVSKDEFEKQYLEPAGA
jgi:diguanylate cyclase (GGDEF)-like protein